MSVLADVCALDEEAATMFTAITMQRAHAVRSITFTDWRYGLASLSSMDCTT